MSEPFGISANDTPSTLIAAGKRNTSGITYPRTASMATLPCFSSASRYRRNFSSSPSADKPKHKIQLITSYLLSISFVILLTNREDRNLYLQAYQLLSDQATQAWKFLPATWITLTKADLGLVVQTIFTYVQAQYDWEKAKAAEINAVTTTVADLASINLFDA